MRRDRRVRTEAFRSESDRARHPDVQGGCEPNPDIAIYHRGVWGDSRRWSCDGTFNNLLPVAEVIAAERADSRLQSGEIVSDIRKLDALRQEVQEWESDIVQVMPVVDTVETSEGRMIRSPPGKDRACAEELDVHHLLLRELPLHRP